MVLFKRHEYYGKGSELIPLTKLPEATRESLVLIGEVYGVQWNRHARRIKSMGRYFYLVEGTGPAGEEVLIESGDGITPIVLIDGEKFELRDLGLRIPSVSELTRMLRDEALEALRARDRELVNFEDLSDSVARTKLEHITRHLTGFSPFVEEELLRFAEEAEKRRDEVMLEKLKERKSLPKRRTEMEEE